MNAWDAMVGDEVLVRGTAVRVVPGVGVLVELFSKTDRYEAWVRHDMIADVLLPEPPLEPPDGAIALGGPDGEYEHGSVFRRDDAEGHNDRGTRRHDRHWWDYAASEWVDWPTAVGRGANPAAQLVAHVDMSDTGGRVVGDAD